MAITEISDLKVMMSNAGYYIGRTCTEDGIEGIPYSRESEYYKTREKAEVYLQLSLKFGYLEN